MRLKVPICLTLALITFGLYWPTRHFAFLNFDDQYFLLSPYVSAGLSFPGVYWALTSVVAENWHPITTFSFLLMHQFFGLNPGAEHLLNAGIHAANVALLFLVLMEMTTRRPDGGTAAPPCQIKEAQRFDATCPSSQRFDATWRSAIVAAIFAWHPLRVESVAWIAERKDVLFMFFMLLSLLCYARYTRAGPGKPLPPPDKRTIFDTPPRTVYFNLALLFFVFSLLSKAMSVTLPFLLLLLDVWPLKRFNICGLREERDGFEGGVPLQGFNAPAAPKHSDGGSESASTLLPRRKLVTAGQPLLREKLPFFAASALFCIITFHIQKAHDALASLHQIGAGARMENVICSYAGYLGKLFWPSNLAIIYPFSNSFDAAQVVLSGLLLVAISALCVLQISRRPYLAVGWFWFLGTMVPVIGLVQLGEQGMADRYTYLPLIGPVISLVWLVSEWVRANSFRKWVAIAATALVLATCAVLTTRQLQYWRDTVTLFTHSIAVTRNNSLAEFPLAKALQNEGLLRQAAAHYRIAIARGADDENFWPNFYFAELLDKEGHYQEAKKCMETAVQIKPNQADALNNLAWILSTCPDEKVRDGERAVKLAERACELTHDRSAKFLSTLGAAYAEAGRFDDAIATIEKAGALAQQTGQDALFNGDAQLLELFTNHQTYTDKSK